MTEPEYHKQPTTFDPTKPDIPEDAPLAQGHTRELAEEVREADAEHTEAVHAEEEYAQERESEGLPADVGARDPGDHAGESSSPSDDAPGSDGEVPNGSVDEVLAWVGDDHDRAQQALAAERDRPTPRTSLISKLEQI